MATKTKDGWEVWEIENSSRVSKIEFKETPNNTSFLKFGELKLTFKNNNQKYLYHNVPKVLVLNAIKAESVGKALNIIIKNPKIKYEKIKEE